MSAGSRRGIDGPNGGPDGVARWLVVEGARFVETLPLVAELGRQLVREGLAIDRITTGVPLLHPQIFSSSVLWEFGKEPTERRYQLSAELQIQYQNSPMFVVYNEGIQVRCVIGNEAAENEYPIIADLRREGYTDYVALPLTFSDGSFKAVTFATRMAGGFFQRTIAELESLVPALALIVERQTLARMARTLLDTYVGPVAGQRVLAGTIKRGMGETIHAVIWFCDLRGFTALSDSLPRDAIIELLNDYFGAMTEAVAEAGGEVLKFIGDAMLAIFPFADDASAAAMSLAALGAARRAGERLNETNRRREAAGQPPIGYGIALHAGDVLYGNIGGVGRLDFTVIGPTVNMASRLQGLCGELGERVLLSAAFANLAGNASQPLGAFRLKGIGEPAAVYRPRD